MIPRYEDPEISSWFTNKAKLAGWQNVELATLEARANLDLIPRSVYERIKMQLEAQPFDIEWWLARDKAIHHDLNAFLEERVRHLDAELSGYFHQDMTSYDTEDPAFARVLVGVADIMLKKTEALLGVLSRLAGEHRHTVMIRRTHGQAAKLGTFGGRVLTWIAMLTDGYEQLLSGKELCNRSRISGAVGNYGGNMTPAIEREALRILGLVPYYGATQIVPRTVHAPLAQALLVVAEAVGKIALDIRLAARSGMPLMHEPFAKIQKGSSAMPHKKNPIVTEQIEGLVRLARGYVSALVSNIPTWEERAIEQSCVERVAWPDLFHVVSRIVTQMARVCSGVVVYPDRMLQEVIDARGTYATDEAKNFLAKKLGMRGVSSETAYRIVQLASFCVFEPSEKWLAVRTARPETFQVADDLIVGTHPPYNSGGCTISALIESAALMPVASLEADESLVGEWNALLRDVFASAAVRHEWQDIFLPSRLLRSEGFLFEKILA